jgi:ribA/ribD-fused uncharacterized protein
MTINQFSGEFGFLSNFSTQMHAISPLGDGLWYPTTEHAYQAGKTLDTAQRIQIAQAPTPGKAKKLGRLVALRYDWEQVKVEIMMLCLMEKFNQPTLRQKLIATFPQQMIEGNWWGDTYWGWCFKTQSGRNMLGRCLSVVRDYYIMLETLKQQV